MAAINCSEKCSSRLTA